MYKWQTEIGCFIELYVKMQAIYHSLNNMCNRSGAKRQLCFELVFSASIWSTSLALIQGLCPDPIGFQLPFFIAHCIVWLLNFYIISFTAKIILNWKKTELHFCDVNLCLFHLLSEFWCPRL